MFPASEKADTHRPRKDLSPRVVSSIPILLLSTILLIPCFWQRRIQAGDLASHIFLVTFGSVLWFVFRFSRECSALPFFAAISIPALTAICGVQDTPLLLAILGVSILLTRRTETF